MITREQAEQAFNERWQHPNALLRSEVRKLELTQIDSQQMDLDDWECSSLGVFEVLSPVWKCTFEQRNRKLSLGEWAGKWDEWRQKTCYIVEPQPGAYIVD